MIRHPARRAPTASEVRRGDTNRPADRSSEDRRHTVPSVLLEDPAETTNLRDAVATPSEIAV